MPDAAAASALRASEHSRSSLGDELPTFHSCLQAAEARVSSFELLQHMSQAAFVRALAAHALPGANQGPVQRAADDSGVPVTSPSDWRRTRFWARSEWCVPPAH